MVRIAMSAAAYDAIASTLPRGLSGPSFFRAATVPHPRRGGRPRPSEGHAWTGLWTLCNWGFKPDADDCNGGDRRHSPEQCLKGALRLLLRHPGLAQAFDYPVPIVETARIDPRIGDVSLIRNPRGDGGPESGIRERKETSERFAGLRLTPTQGERRDEVFMRMRIVIRPDRDRLLCRFDRLIVLLQR